MTAAAELVLMSVMLLAIIVGPLATAFYLLMWRKRRAREARRSPLTQGLLRPAGRALQERVEAVRNDLSTEASMLMFLPTLPLATFQVQQLITGRSVSAGTWWLVAALTVVAVGYVIRRLLRHSALLDRLRLGLDAEMAVGQELEALRSDGAVVFHDLPADKFNVDHVVVARQGVFAVETKGYSKPGDKPGSEGATIRFDGRALFHPDWHSEKPVEQVIRQAAWLSSELTKATGEPVHVAPVLVLPGWFVERTGRGDVIVISGAEVRKNLLAARTARPLDDAQRQRISHQLEQRCRTLAPSYSPEPDD